MKAHLINTHLLLPWSSSSAKAKVEYQGYISQKKKKKKNGRFGGIRVSQTHLVSFSCKIYENALGTVSF